jgi:hypothetical protein
VNTGTPWIAGTANPAPIGARRASGRGSGRARCRDDWHAGFGGAGRGNGPPATAAPRPGSTLRSLVRHDHAATLFSSAVNSSGTTLTISARPPLLGATVIRQQVSSSDRPRSCPRREAWICARWSSAFPAPAPQVAPPDAEVPFSSETDPHGAYSGNVAEGCLHCRTSVGNRVAESPAIQTMALTRVNNHLAHLSAFFTWTAACAPPGLHPHGDPTGRVERLRRGQLSSSRHAVGVCWDVLERATRRSVTVSRLPPTPDPMAPL